MTLLEMQAATLAFVRRELDRHQLLRHGRLTGRARAIYLGDEEERWGDLQPQVRAHAEHVVSEIIRLGDAT